MNTGVLLIDLEGTELSPEESEILCQPEVAGVLFFARNFQDRSQLCQLVNAIRALREDLLICVDQEGGRVQRFKKGFTRLPPVKAYGQLLQNDREQGLQLAHEAGWLMASELLSCGVDLSLGPVLDIDHGRTNIVGDRAFSTNSDDVTELATAWVEGVHEAGMSAVIKHFPGHGSVDGDSHECQPVDSRTFEEIDRQDLLPFKALIHAGVEAVMPAHIVFPAIDEQPAGFSRVWQDQVLRGQLGFGGLIVSDCLSMEGAASAGGYPDRVWKGLEAGCDLLIVSNRKGVRDVLEEAQESSLRGVGPNRLLTVNRPDWKGLVQSSRHRQTVSLLEALG
ncbi:MAG: beta-N-acetylhexosaminidase [Endozoicomonas sp.]